jgi:hypothetical protein
VVTYIEPVPDDTYYAPQLPTPMNSAASYTVPVTLTNTTVSTWAPADWVLSYHWLLPDGTDVSNSSDQVQTADWRASQKTVATSIVRQWLLARLGPLGRHLMACVSKLNPSVCSGKERQCPRHSAGSRRSASATSESCSPTGCWRPRLWAFHL